jgi:hypothetical protein
MSFTNTQEVYEIKSISLVHINPSIVEGTKLYESILGPMRAVSINKYAPVFLFNPVLTGDPGIPNILTCSAGVVDASPAPQRHYTWYADEEEIVGASGFGPAFSTLLTNSSMDSKEITCMVTATNFLGSASAMSNGIVVTIIEPIQVVELGYFTVTGISSQDAISVYEDQIAILTGMWVDDFITTFDASVFGITRVAMDDYTTVLDIDLFGVEIYTPFTSLSAFNSGAESGTSGWSTTSGTLRSVAGNSVSGSNVFMGSDTASVTTQAFRIVSIPSGNHDEIDDGELYFSMSFYASRRGTTERSHTCRAYYEFLDDDDESLGEFDFNGYFTPELNGTGSGNNWNYIRAPMRPVPPLTRKIRVNMDFPSVTHSGGNICQIDDISLNFFELS